MISSLTIKTSKPYPSLQSSVEALVVRVPILEKTYSLIIDPMKKLRNSGEDCLSTSIVYVCVCHICYLANKPVNIEVSHEVLSDTV